MVSLKQVINFTTNTNKEQEKRAQQKLKQLE